MRAKPGVTANFHVTGLSAETNQQVADAAERERHEQAEYWFGQPFPHWSAPARVTIGGITGVDAATMFRRESGEVFAWHGVWLAESKERLLRDVVPHEVSHAVWHSHWRAAKEIPPRWLDEGLATLMESESENRRSLAVASKNVRSLEAILADPSYGGNPTATCGMGYAVCLKVLQTHGKDGLVRMADGVAHRSTERGFMGLGYRSSHEFGLRFRLPVFGGLIHRRCHCRDRADEPPAPAVEPGWMVGPPGPQGPRGLTGATGPAGRPSDDRRITELEKEVAELRKQLDNFSDELPFEVAPER